jgi:hypothetical protein
VEESVFLVSRDEKRETEERIERVAVYFAILPNPVSPTIPFPLVTRREQPPTGSADIFERQ